MFEMAGENWLICCHVFNRCQAFSINHLRNSIYEERVAVGKYFPNAVDIKCGQMNLRLS
jgi:hypothetical protein